MGGERWSQLGVARGDGEAERLTILNAERAAQIGTPEDIYNRPKSFLVASFIGGRNIVAVTPRDGGNRIALNAGPYSEAVEIRSDARARGAVHAHFRCKDARLCDLTVPQKIVSCRTAGSPSLPIWAGSIVLQSESAHAHTWPAGAGSQKIYKKSDPE